MEYKKGKKITDNCQFKKGRKYIDQCNGYVFEFSHIGENGKLFFKYEGLGCPVNKYEYNCIVYESNVDFYEAIEVAPELPDEGLVAHETLGSIVYRTSKETGYGFSKYGTFENYNDCSTIWSFKYYPEDWRPATPGEERKFIELLKEECERRGLYEDTKIKAHAGIGTQNINKSNFIVHTTLCSAWNTNGCIFNKGKFAEPLEKEDTTTLDAKIKELIELGKSKGLKVNVTFE